MTRITFEVPPQHTDELLALLQRWNGTTLASSELSSAAPIISEVARPAPTEPVITIEEVRQSLTTISQTGMAAQVKTLLAEFGARNVKELKREDFAAVLEKANYLWKAKVA